MKCVSDAALDARVHQLGGSLPGAQFQGPGVNGLKDNEEYKLIKYMECVSDATTDARLHRQGGLLPGAQLQGILVLKVSKILKKAS